jgi:LacI family transcriptional regulator
VKKATIYDVAEAAGVGISTVSNAASGARGVSPRTRERVMAAIERLGWTPNFQARLLSSRKNVKATNCPTCGCTYHPKEN